MEPGALGGARFAVGAKLGALARRHAHSICLGSLSLAFLVPRVPLLSRPLYGDELHSFIRYVKGRSFVEIVWGDFAANNHVLNSLVMKATYLCAGEVPTLLRLPHLLCALVAILLLFRMASETIGRPAALVAALLASLHPATLLYSVWGRGYALMLLFTLLSCRLFLGALESPTRKGLALYSVVSAVATTTHLFAVLVILAQAAMVLLGPVAARKPSAGTVAGRWRPQLPLLLCQLGVLAFALATNYPVLLSAPSEESFPFQAVFPLVLLNFLNGYEYWTQVDVWACLTALVALAGMPALRSWPDGRRLIAWLFATPIAMYAVSSALPAFTLYPRFFAFLVPFYCLLFAAGLLQIARLVLSKLAGGVVQRLAVGTAALACALPVAVSFADKANVRDMEEMAHVQEVLASLIERNEDVALFTNNKVYFAVRLRQDAHEKQMLTATSVAEAGRLLSESPAPFAFFVYVKFRPVNEEQAVRYNEDQDPEERLRDDRLLRRFLASTAEYSLDFSPYATVFVLRTARGRSTGVPVPH